MSLDLGEAFKLVLAVRNGETEAASFAVRVSFDARRVIEVPHWQGCNLAACSNLGRRPGNGRTALTFELYRADGTRTYRVLEFFVNLSLPSLPLVLPN